MTRCPLVPSEAHRLGLGFSLGSGSRASAHFDSSAWSAGVRILAVRLPRTVRNSTRTKRISLGDLIAVQLLGALVRSPLKPRRFELERREDRIALGGDVDHAIDNGSQGDAPQRLMGAPPHGAKSPLERMKQAVRGQILGAPFQPGVHASACSSSQPSAALASARWLAVIKAHLSPLEGLLRSIA